MNDKKNVAGNLLPMTVTEGLTVNVLPYKAYEYLMTVSEVANGYGTSKYAILKTMQRNSGEFIENKHFILGVDILSSPIYKGVRGKIQNNSYLFTKSGIVRLGFFIKSERAKLFRDWAEELIIRIDEQRDLFGNSVSVRQLPAGNKTRANRLTSERLLDIMTDVCRIDDRELRLSITNKLMGGRQQ